MNKNYNSIVQREKGELHVNLLKIDKNRQNMMNYQQQTDAKSHLCNSASGEDRY